MRDRIHKALRRAAQVSAPVALALAALTVGADVQAVVPAHCVSVDVPVPVILPDGSIHPAGEVRLCLTRNYNPVTGLHRVYLDRMPVGMILSRVSNAELPKSSPPTVLFYGNLASGLRLVGYTVAANGKVFSYLLWNARAAPGTDVADGSSGRIGGSMVEDSERFFLTARLD